MTSGDCSERETLSCEAALDAGALAVASNNEKWVERVFLAGVFFGVRASGEANLSRTKEKIPLANLYPAKLTQLLGCEAHYLGCHHVSVRIPKVSTAIETTQETVV